MQDHLRRVSLTAPCPLLGSQCSAVSAADGRWRVTSCSASLPTACRADSAAISGAGAVPSLALGAQPGPSGDAPLWVFNKGIRGHCPEDYSHKVPRTAKENMYLQRALEAAGLSAAWLPVHGPLWELP